MKTGFFVIRIYCNSTKNTRNIADTIIKFGVIYTLSKRSRMHGQWDSLIDNVVYRHANLILIMSLFTSLQINYVDGPKHEFILIAWGNVLSGRFRTTDDKECIFDPKSITENNF